MSTSPQPTGSGQPQPAVNPQPDQQPDVRCDCDHLRSEHGDSDRCKVFVLDREATFRHLCRCPGFNHTDHLKDAEAIIAGQTLKMPQMRHLEAFHAEIGKLRKEVRAAAFMLRVARNSFGKFTVLCEGCNDEQGFSSDGVDEAATWLEQNGWELERRDTELKLVCANCFGQYN